MPHSSVVPRSTLRPTSRGKIIGHDPAMCAVLDILDRVAATTCTVLVTGESGTGKELVVAALHDRSKRADGPLVAINCGAIPAELVESELFGNARGAFTGALSARKGLVASAEGGTLFLDEVGELPLAAQVKLLRLLQAREYTPVGDTKVHKCDVRVVAATNRDLLAEVKAGRFREDLYFRLDVIHVHLPALRERRMDIPVLASHFLRSCAERVGRDDLTGFEPDALEAMKNGAWNGNVRALENVVERLVLLSSGPRIRKDELPATLLAATPASGPQRIPSVTWRLPDEGLDLGAAVADYENKLIAQALDRTNGNKNRAAQLLNMNRTTLVEMIKRKGAAIPVRDAS